MLTERIVTLASFGLATWVAMVPPERGSASEPPLAWEGPGAHLHVVGRIGGEPLAVEARGRVAIDAIGLACGLRETRLDAAGGPAATGIRFEAVAGGERRLYELAFVGHAIERARDGAYLHVIPLRAEPRESDHSVQFAIEWRDAAAMHAPREGRASETGSFHRVELHRPRSPDADALAGHLRASWTDGDSLDLSFTVPCRR